MTKFHIRIELWDITTVSESAHVGEWCSDVNAETVADAIKIAHTEMDRLGFHSGRKVPEVTVIREAELSATPAHPDRRTSGTPHNSAASTP